MARKIVKWLLLAALALAVLAALALAIVPALLPLEDMAVQAIHEHTGRQARVESIDLRLLGGAELEVKGLRIDDLPRFGGRPLLKLDRLLVEFGLLPLLTRKVDLGQVLVDGLELSLVRDQQGALNTDFAAAQPPADQPAAPPETPPAEAPAADEPHAGSLIVRRLAISGSTIFLANLATGSQASLPLQKAELTTEFDAQTPLIQAQLAMPGLGIEASGGQASAPAELKAEIDLAQLGQRLIVVWPGLELAGELKLAAAAVGPDNQKVINASCRALNLRISSPTPGQAPFELADADLTLAMVADQSARSLQLESLSLRSQAAGYEMKAHGLLAPGRAELVMGQKTDLAKLYRVLANFLPAGLTLAGQAEKEFTLRGDEKKFTLDFQSRADGLEVNTPGLARPFRQAQLISQGKLIVDAQGNMVIDKLSLECPDAHLEISGKAAVEPKKTAHLTLASKIIDLDAILPLLQALDQNTTATPPKAPPAATARPAAPAKPADQAAQLVKILQEIDIDIELNLAHVAVGGHHLLGVNGRLLAGQGQAAIEGLKCGLLDGALNLDAKLICAGNQEPKSNINLTATGLRIDKERYQHLKKNVALFYLPLSAIRGVFDIQAQLAAQGLDVETIKASATGKGGIQAPRGVEIDIDALGRMTGGDFLADIVRDNVPGQYGSLDGSYTLAKGRLDYQLLFADSPERIDVKLAGHTNLLDRAITAKLLLSGQGLGRDLRPFLGPDGAFPLELGGTADKPTAVLNIKEAAGGLLRGLFNR
ncbi:DUF748 domain-containing protein [Desulfarculus baarsii]